MVKVNTLKPSKSFDWRSLKRYLNPRAVGDLDHFLDSLPARAGHAALIAVAILWAAAGASILLATMKAGELRELREEIAERKAVTPEVPKITTKAVTEEEIVRFATKAQRAYPRIQIDSKRNNVLNIYASNTNSFATWRTVLDNLTYAGQARRLEIISFCVGRECAGPQLQAQVKVVTLDISAPAVSG